MMVGKSNVITLPVINRARAEKAVSLKDCSGREYTPDEREDIIRYLLLGAEMQRDIDIKERKRVCGDILHYLVASRQETINNIMERGQKGVVRKTRWHKCIDEAIDWVRYLYKNGVELDDEFVCFHITTKDRLASIIKEGLKPNAEPNWFESPTPYVMLSKYPYWALYDGDMILLEIKHPDILPEYFNDPEGLRWGEVIPPEYINRIVDFKVIGGKG